MTDFFDEIVYGKEDVICFQKGIPGFEEHKEFALVKMPDFEPFEWLVSTKTSKLRFAVINPMVFKQDYDPKIKKEQIQELELKEPGDVLIYSIVTLSNEPAKTTANLMGPIIINRKKRIGKQIILEDNAYSVKERILQ